MWENFPNGGNWVLRMRKGCVLLDRMWEELLIACIGEAFEEPDVLGVVLSIRPKEDALYVWNANQQLKYNIGEKLKTIMHLAANCPMEYRTNRFNMERRLVPGQKGVEGVEEQEGGIPPGHGAVIDDNKIKQVPTGIEHLEKLENPGKVEEQ